MKGTAFEFRFRLPIVFAMYILGFYAPWARDHGHDTPLWSWLAIEIAHLHLLSTLNAYTAVTLAAILLAWAGALLRVWGTAWMSHRVMNEGRLLAGPDNAVVAGGPYRYVRNPLYIGSWLASAAVAILMPASGGALFLLVEGVFLLRLIGAEEAWLSPRMGEPYTVYRSRVPRLFPSLRPRVPAPKGAQPRWLHSIMAETYPLGLALCFTILAWRYELNLLARWVLIAFGVSLVVRALLPREQAVAEAA